MDASMPPAPLARWIMVAAFALALLASLYMPRTLIAVRGSAPTAKPFQTSSMCFPVIDTTTYVPSPLFDSVSHFSKGIFGNTAWGKYLPSLLAAAATLLLVWWLGRTLGNERVGWAAAGILVSCLGFFSFVPSNMPYMLATFWITASISCLVARWRGGAWIYELGFIVTLLAGVFTSGWLCAVAPLAAALALRLGMRSVGMATPPGPEFESGVLGFAIVAGLVFLTASGVSIPPAPVVTLLPRNFFNKANVATELPGLASALLLVAGAFPWLLVALGALLHH